MRDTHRTDDHSDQMHPGDPFVEGKWWFVETGRYLPHRFVDKNVQARRRACRYFNLVEVLASRASIKMSWDVSACLAVSDYDGGQIPDDAVANGKRNVGIFLGCLEPRNVVVACRSH